MGCTSEISKDGIDEIIIEKRVETGAAPLEHPILYWEVVRVPKPGIVQRLTGAVARLTTDEGWIPLQDGESLPVNCKLWIYSGASMVVRFSESEYIEFNAAPKDRWVEFDAPQTQ